MRKSELLHPELSYKLTGLCFEAHNEIGRYGREKQYGDFLEGKLKQSGIPYKRELTIANTGNILDFLVDDKIVLELKSKVVVTKEDYRQTQRYLTSTSCNLGLIVNFRDKYLKPKRVIKVDKKIS